jgi:hypothetical protein
MTAENRETIPVEAIRDADIQPGLIIEGFPNVGALDLLVRELQAVIVETHISPEQQKKVTNDRLSLLYPPSKTFPPDNFHGRLQNLRVTILPSDTSFVGNPSENVIPESAINFLAAADMHSSGKGIIGTTEREYVLYIRYRKSGIAPLAPYVMMTSRLLTQETKTQVQENIRASRAIGGDVWINALQRATSAGLPTLGKRR